MTGHIFKIYDFGELLMSGLSSNRRARWDHGHLEGVTLVSYRFDGSPSSGPKMRIPQSLNWSVSVGAAAERPVARTGP